MLATKGKNCKDEAGRKMDLEGTSIWRLKRVKTPETSDFEGRNGRNVKVTCFLRKCPPKSSQNSQGPESKGEKAFELNPTSHEECFTHSMTVGLGRTKRIPSCMNTTPHPEQRISIAPIGSLFSSFFVGDVHCWETDWPRPELNNYGGFPSHGGAPFEQCSKPWLVDDLFGDYTTLYIFGITIVQERGISIIPPVFHGMLSFITHFIDAFSMQ